MKEILILLLSCASLLASDTAGFRVHYNIKGSGRDVTILAESPAEARRTVMQMLPGAIVTGLSHVN
jgi:hypothetical protein